MDAKLLIKLFADILYIKGVLNADELDGLDSIATVRDLDTFTERLLRGEFNAYKQGEHYTGYAR